MLEQGKVIEVLGNGIARVEFTSTAGCKKCGICKMMGDKVFVDALNEIGAGKGERVTVEIEPKSVLWATFLLFIAPLIGLFLGYYAGGVLFAFLACGLTFVLIALYDRYLRSKQITVKVTHKIPS
jgi:sigma-E factor negative regulatory protein RseC